jgi:aspartokinase/homoserine dehydrogenase 1
MKVLKFGGKSLQPVEALTKAIEIIDNSHKEDKLTVIVSAIGQSTDLLLELYEKTSRFDDITREFEAFKKLQNKANSRIDLAPYFNALHNNLEQLKKDGPSPTHEAAILAFGELISANVVTALLQERQLNSVFVDARELITGQYVNNEFIVDQKKSAARTRAFIDGLSNDQLPVITGFIASDQDGKTATMGRNGSNYSTALIANYLDAAEVQNWTDVDGIYAASPKLVPEAQRIEQLSYKEAHELANFGASILHPKTIAPLMEKEIPLKIYSSFSQKQEGTTVSKDGGKKGIKAVSVIQDVALISIEGKGLLGKVGIDARIFTALSRNGISVRLISQASSERGIGFVVDAVDAPKATTILHEEFGYELLHGDVSRINYDNNMAIIAIVGRHNYSLEKAIKGLRRNKIWMHLISNSISGEHISLVIDNRDIKKAVNIVHSQVFGVIKTINLFAIGKGLVGGHLLDQILATPVEVEKRRNLRIRLVGVADSQRFIFKPLGLGTDWRDQLQASSRPSSFEEITRELENSALENIVIADNTSSQEVADWYPRFLNNQFDIVASNKKANSGPYENYAQIRQIVNRRGRLFNYETNVGAGLPIIDTIKYLYDSADQITRIRGVFSGSLSYIFNNYSDRQVVFSEILHEARKAGLSEPDPREDLSGQDVARKLVILAREVGLVVELEDVKLTNLIPDELSAATSYEAFWEKKNVLDSHYQSIKDSLTPDEVLRYVADLDPQSETLTISLQKVVRSSPLGGIKNADALFEIFTESYGEEPFVIQGAGAGGAVTARGVYSDLIRMGHKY